MPMLTKFLPLPDRLQVTYRETGQPNPIRWQLYYLQGDELAPQTNLFKCKDFFNDIVGWYHGKTGKIYGFDTTEMQFNDFGVFVRLSYVLKGFLYNVEKVVNPLLSEKLLFVEVANGEVLTLLPRELFNNTFIISKVSHLLRLCNIERSVDSLDDLIKGHPFEYVDSPLDKLTLPDEYKVYWWYGGEEYNSLTSRFDMTWLHNNGYKSWRVATKGAVQ